MEIIRRVERPKDELVTGISKTPKVNTSALDVFELEIAPGSGLNPHDMPCKVVFCVLDGTGTFNYDGVDETVNVNEIVHVDPGKIRFWSNKTTKPLKILVVRSITEK